MIYIKETCYKGCNIKLGNLKREIINNIIDISLDKGYQEINIPIIQYTDVFSGKVGNENQHMMFTVKDKSDRNLCLAPEYTAVIQQLAKTTFKTQKDVKLFYVQECFRGEKPQRGRFRQFTQFGIEIINPSKEYNLIELAIEMIKTVTTNFKVIENVQRGLDYYIPNSGFEIHCPQLGTASQICGGGAYEGGYGFAIGIDRLLELYNN